MIMSLCLQILSFTMTLLFCKTPKWPLKLIFLLVSCFSGWTSYLLVDYAIGMEVFRVILIYFYLGHREPINNRSRVMKKTVTRAIPFLIIPIGFLVWRTFFFQNFRPETDISLQLSQFIASPLATGALWIQNSLKSFINVFITGWIKPFYDNFFPLEIKKVLFGALLSGLALVLIFFLFRQNEETNQEEGTGENDHINWRKEAIIGGLIGFAGGILPIILMNRAITIEKYSHYLLPVLIAAVPVLVATIDFSHSRRFRQASYGIIVVVAIFSNYCYSVNVVKEEKAITDFWQQVTIRVPDLQKGTTVLVQYPNSYDVDNFETFWGPLNYLYYPKSELVKTQGEVQYPYGAVNRGLNGTQSALVGTPELYEYRSHRFMQNYGQMLVISQSSPDSCVHVIDSRSPQYSITDDDQILLFGGRSNVSNILLNRTYLNYDERLFGKIDPNSWCTLYQQAELALQEGDWGMIKAIDEHAMKDGLKPADEVEWIPFLQAAFHDGDLNRVKEIMTVIQEPFIRMQACSTLQAMKSSQIIGDSAKTYDPMDVLVCK
jgi:hypothetical protein